MEDTDTSQSIEDSGCEIKELILKLTRWSREREQSQRWLDKLLSSYSGTVDKDINDLTKEVGHLKAQLSAVTEERNELLDTNTKLGNESGNSIVCLG